jgi:hypothetical protein
VAPIVAVIAALLAAASAQAAIPASGTVVEGIGPSFGRIGTSGAAVKARLGLVCAPVSVGGAARRCFNSLSSAVNYPQIDGAGRIEAWSFSTGAWTTSRGVGLGSRIAAVRAAYGRALSVRRTPVWTYMTLRRTIAGQPRVTLLLGRTKVGDVVQLAVWRERRQILRPVAPVTPAGSDLSVRLIDVAPRETWQVEVRAPWQTFTTLPKVRADTNGNATVVLPRRRGTLAQILAVRPAGTASPVTLTFRVRGVDRTTTTRVRVALPPPPTLSYSLPVMSEADPGTVTVAGMEALASYGLSAEWACPTGAAGRIEDAAADPIFSTAGPDQTVAVDAASISADAFDPSCAGSPAPPTLPVTLVLSRSTERVAQITVTLSGAPGL